MESRTHKKEDMELMHRFVLHFLRSASIAFLVLPSVRFTILGEEANENWLLWQLVTEPRSHADQKLVFI